MCSERAGGSLRACATTCCNTVLRDEQHVLWVDADVLSVPGSLLPSMLDSGALSSLASVTQV